MKPSKWNVKTAALYGAVAGAPLLLARSVAFGEALPTQLAELIGFAVGGVIGGVILFSLVATVRNVIVR